MLSDFLNPPKNILGFFFLNDNSHKALAAYTTSLEFFGLTLFPLLLS
jgi:hypothetical protein